MRSWAERNQLQFREEEKKTKLMLVYFPITQMGFSKNRHPEFMLQINNRHNQLHCKERAVKRWEKAVSFQESLLETIESLLKLGCK